MPAVTPFVANVNGMLTVPLPVALPVAAPDAMIVMVAGLATLNADRALLTYAVVATCEVLSVVGIVAVVNEVNAPTDNDPLIVIFVSVEPFIKGWISLNNKLSPTVTKPLLPTVTFV